MDSRWICIVSPEEGKGMVVRIDYCCDGSGKHPHYTRNRVRSLIADGTLAWVSENKRVAMYRSARTWSKVYTRNRVGEVLHCGMQLISGARR